MSPSRVEQERAEIRAAKLDSRHDRESRERSIRAARRAAERNR